MGKLIKIIIILTCTINLIAGQNLKESNKVKKIDWRFTQFPIELIQIIAQYCRFSYDFLNSTPAATNHKILVSALTNKFLAYCEASKDSKYKIYLKSIETSKILDSQKILGRPSSIGFISENLLVVTFNSDRYLTEDGELTEVETNTPFGNSNYIYLFYLNNNNLNICKKIDNGHSINHNACFNRIGELACLSQKYERSIEHACNIRLLNLNLLSGCEKTFSISDPNIDIDENCLLAFEQTGKSMAICLFDGSLKLLPRNCKEVSIGKIIYNNKLKEHNKIIGLLLYKDQILVVLEKRLHSRNKQFKEYVYNYFVHTFNITDFSKVNRAENLINTGTRLNYANTFLDKFLIFIDHDYNMVIVDIEINKVIKLNKYFEKYRNLENISISLSPNGKYLLVKNNNYLDILQNQSTQVI